MEVIREHSSPKINKSIFNSLKQMVTENFQLQPFHARFSALLFDGTILSVAITWGQIQEGHPASFASSSPLMLNLTRYVRQHTGILWERR